MVQHALPQVALPQIDGGYGSSYRAHVIDHRAALRTPRQGDDGGDADPMPSPRSAVARNQLRSSYAPPQRGTRAMYIPSAVKAAPVAERVQPDVLQPPPGFAPLQPQPPAHRLQSSRSASTRQPAVKPLPPAMDGPSRPPPWWWPKGIEATDASLGLPRSLASMLASQMVKVAASTEDEGPTRALQQAERVQALQAAQSPFQLVSAAVRTRAPSTKLDFRVKKTIKLLFFVGKNTKSCLVWKNIY